MRGIRKEFPGTVANDNVSLEVRRGEVHALLGENGAGKSTLMNILYGLYRPDAGELLLNGKRVEFSSARDAIGAGIGMVHQHFMLIPVMTVAENIVLGVEPRHNLLLDERTAERRVRELSERFSLAVDPAALVSDITVGQEQRVEILKALYRGADILILDEPWQEDRDGFERRSDRGVTRPRDGGTRCAAPCREDTSAARRRAALSQRPPCQ
jgi:simple sugar transport system ATP-binding protein